MEEGNYIATVETVDEMDQVRKTVFYTRYEHYEFLMMSFGLTNVRMAFMNMFNRVFQSYSDRIAIVFVDGILNYKTQSISRIKKSMRNTYTL